MQLVRTGPKPMSYTIAIVEDDADQRRNYQEAMEKKGFTVRAFADRPQAHTAMAEQAPDLVILDIMLGNEVDGGFNFAGSCWPATPSYRYFF